MRRTIAGIGRVCLTLGLLILLFVGYQLWGTGIIQARAQDRLASQLDDLQGQVAPVRELPDAEREEPERVELPPIGPGDPLGRIVIPAAGVDEIFVAGVSRQDLQQGPGHYPGTPLPGQRGNAAIAGHRTTYGAPFFDLDRLEPGDWIATETLLGRHVYVVTETLVVNPTDVWVVDDTPDAQLTLTTCHPRYSARQRLVVKAELLDVDDAEGPAGAGRSDAAVGEVGLPGGSGTIAGLPGFEGEATSLQAGLGGDPTSWGPTIAWGLVALGTGLAWWWAFRRWRHPATWFLGAVPFLVALFPFYVNLERLLPAGY